MKIAIPTVNGKLNMHFGHCAAFILLDVDPATKTITATTEIDAPPHEPGLLPKFLAERNVNLIIAGGMGSRAQALFTAQNIDVIVGAPCESPETLVAAYLSGELETGTNACDH
jgi:predicted Fe-Mo cluster-binding NifX family protein